MYPAIGKKIARNGMLTNMPIIINANIPAAKFARPASNIPLFFPINLNPAHRKKPVKRIENRSANPKAKRPCMVFLKGLKI